MNRIFLLLTLMLFGFRGFGQNNLSVRTDIEHINPESGYGRIQVSFSGGSAPYRLSWSDGVSDSVSRRINSKTDLTISVTDSSNSTQRSSAKVLYEMSWSEQDTAYNSEGNSLFRFLSSNRLKTGRNGQLLFFPDDPRSSIEFGLTKDTTLSAFLNYGFSLVHSRIYIVLNDRVIGQYGKIKKGDSLFVKRESSRINFYRNSVRLYSSNDSGYDLRVVVKTSKIPENLLSDFNIPLSVHIRPHDNHCDSLINGKFEMTVKGGDQPYIFSYYKGYEKAAENRLENIDLPAGPYSISVLDKNADEVLSKVAIGYLPLIGNPAGTRDLINTSNSVSKSGESTWCNGDLSIENKVLKDRQGWLEFELEDTLTTAFVGVYAGSNNVSASGLLFLEGKCYHFDLDEDAQFEKRPLPGTKAAGKFKIQFANGSMILSQNGRSIGDPISFEPSSDLRYRIQLRSGSVKNIRTSNSCKQ